jgi:hypothetical protein
MKTQNFEKLISQFTGRNFIVCEEVRFYENENKSTQDVDLRPEKTYTIGCYLDYQISNRTTVFFNSFNFKVPKNEENIVKSFITNFTSKYKCADPERVGETSNATIHFYTNCYPRHIMKSKTQLLNEVKQNLQHPNTEYIMCKYGFYETTYGIGIFVLFSTTYELKAVKNLSDFFKTKCIPYTNEFSDKMWVYRFKTGLSKDINKSLLNEFNSKY